MTSGLYHPGDSPVHRMRAGAKLGLLFVAGTLLFFVEAPAGIAAAGLLVLLLFRLGGLPPAALAAELRPALPVIVLVALAQGLLVGWAPGLVAAGRLAVLVALAALVTLTTPASAMLEAFERAFAALRFVGGNPAKAGLALSLALRFIPVVGRIAAEVREAQRARGLERSFVALAVPLLVRTLKMADEVADAIEARGFDPEPPPPRETR